VYKNIELTTYLVLVMKSEREQIDDIKMKFLGTKDTTIRKAVLDTLGTYGEPGIDTINELIGVTVNEEVKEHGLQVITEVRRKLTRND